MTGLKISRNRWPDRRGRQPGSCRWCLVPNRKQMTMPDMHLGQSRQTVRTRENAPPEVLDRGGVALSLWMTGANETDCIIVTGLSIRAEALQIALESVKDALSDLTDATEDIRVEGDGSALTKAWDRAYDLLAGEAE